MPSVGDRLPQRPVASAPVPPGRAHMRQQWVVGVVVGPAITVTASMSLAVVSVGVEDVMLDDLRNYLRRTSETVAAQIDGDTHTRFTDAAQTGTPEYLAISSPLGNLLRTNPDIHFAYTGLIRGGSMYFVLDGERSADRAHVMQADAPTAGELEPARTHQTVVEREPSPTAWGVGIRAYAPLGGRAGAEGAYVGITMSADRYYAWILTGMSEPGDAVSPYITTVLGKPAAAAVLVDAVERAMATGDVSGAWKRPA